MTGEGKENVISMEDHTENLAVRTPLNQMKRTDSQLRGNRRPLASKDNNRTQTILNLKNSTTGAGNTGHALKRRASSLVKNLPDNKLKRYGSILGAPSFLPRTKSLVLKDTELNEDEDGEDEEDDGLPPITGRDHGTKLKFGGGLQALIQEKKDELSIEYAPKREVELPHVPNGYEPFDQECIEKLKYHKSPFQVDPVTFDTEVEEPKLMSLTSIEDGTSSPTKAKFKNHHIEVGLESDDDSINIELNEEYNGNGLSDRELHSLLD